MIPETVFDFGSKLGKLFKLFGELKFLRRLRDYLKHDGKKSRVEILSDTAKAVLELEKADAQRIQNRHAVLELMRCAGLPEEEIQAKMRDAVAMEGVQTALETLLRYVENGSASVRLVSPEEPEVRVLGKVLIPIPLGDRPSPMKMRVQFGKLKKPKVRTKRKA